MATLVGMVISSLLCYSDSYGYECGLIKFSRRLFYNFEILALLLLDRER